MGNSCTSDLLSKFGPEIAQLVSIQKGKEMLDLKTKQVKKQVLEQSKNIRGDIMNNIQNKEAQVDNYMKGAAEDLQKQNPGALKKAAAIQRKSVDEILGGDEIKNRFTDIRQEVDRNFEQQEQNAMQEIDNFKQTQNNQLDRQKPSIPMFDKLSSSQQSKVMKQGEKKFKTQIEAEQRKVQEQIDQNINPSKYTEMFNNLNPTESLNGISGRAQDLIKAAKTMSSGSFAFC